MSVIEAHLADLDATLYGPADARHRLIGEARAGLYDACDAYLAAGLPEPAAADLAVRDFGSVAEVRAAFQVELFETQARRTARLLGVKVPMIAVVWWVGWSANPQQHWRLPVGLHVVAVGLGLLALGAALVGYAAGRRATGHRFGPTLVVPAAVVSTAALVSGVLLHAIPSYQAMAWPPMSLVLVVTALLVASLVSSARRCRLVALA